MKRTKRWLAALLSAVLLASLLPTVALAEDGTLSDGTEATSTANITRAQLAEMIYEKFYSEQSATNQGFTDIGTGQDGQDDPCTDLQWKAINVLAEKKIISGTGENTFNPKDTVTRAEAVVVIWRATGNKSNSTEASVPFTDVYATDWYAPAIAALAAAGIITGTDGGAFNPYGNATVQAVSTLLSKYQENGFNGFSNAATRLEMVVDAYNKYKDSPLAEQVDYSIAAPFADISGCTADETKAIQFFNQLGIVNGYKPASEADDLRFGPYDPASNLQVVMFLYQCAMKFDPETYAAQSSLTEGDTLSAQLVSYALPVPDGVQDRVTAAWEFFGNTAGDLQNNADAPAVSATIDTLTGAITTPAAPTFTPDSDTQPTSVTLSAEEESAIYYTVATDGSDPADPTVNSTRYTAPISITETTTIKAVAVKNSLYSEIAAYTVGGGSEPVGSYPIYIIGPTGEMDSYVDLDEKGEVLLIQGSPDTLFDPHDNDNPAIQEQLKNWIYNGWVFTAEKDGKTEAYGPTKVIDNGLKAFLNGKIKEGDWTLTMNSENSGYWAYPITIIGPTGEMNSYVDLNEDGTVYLIQGSDTTLFDPRTNPDTTIQNQLRYWVYNGWVFTAEKDGKTEAYGPTKVIDSNLKNFLNPKIKEGSWTLTMNSRDSGYYNYPSSDSSSGGSSSGSSGSSGTTTETTRNPDGSTTTTVTKPNGTVTETTKNPDGSSEVVEIQKDGTTTTTTTDTAGNKTEVVEKADGSSQTTVTNTDGSSSATTVSAGGQVETQVKLPAAVVSDAAETGEAVALPMPEVPVTSDRETAPTVTVSFTASTSAKVEIPVANVTAGTVAILVQTDGTEQVVKTSVTTENGVSLTVESGVTVKIVDNAKDFVDVPVTYWASAAIDFATSRELFAGTSGTTFTPGAPMTRVMIVTVLARYASDAPAAVIGYAEGQQWAVEAGISDGSNMSGTVTRQQMAAMLYRYAGSPAVTGSLGSFPDAASVSDYAADAMTWAVENGLITGMTDGTLNPYGWATRAQVATILQRFMVSLAE